MPRWRTGLAGLPAWGMVLLFLIGSSWSTRSADATGAPSEAGRADEAGPPNIVFLVADDLGWGDVGYHGSKIRTPHLDRLAREGVRLEQHYAYPTCSPTRLALLTGHNPSRYGVTHPMGDRSPVPHDAMQLVRRLGEQGYTTHISGKWHLGAEEGARPLDYGFDTSYGYLRGQIDPYTHYYKTGRLTWHRNDRHLQERGHATDLITDEAVRVIESHGGESPGEGESPGDRPFFLYVPYSVPHYPLAESPRWVDPYDGRVENTWRKLFAASVTHMDHGIGRILGALERTGQRRNTLIVFCSDNGGQQSWSAPERLYNGRYPPHTRLGSNEPLRGWKGGLHEGGVRVVALANWPARLKAGAAVASPTHVMDWAPTLIGLAGGAVDAAEFDGRDLWPLLSGRSGRAQPRSFYWDLRHAGALRQGEWKLVVDEEGPPQLFNLAEDPYEEENVAGGHARRVQKMQAVLRRLRQQERPSARTGEAPPPKDKNR